MVGSFEKLPSILSEYMSEDQSTKRISHGRTPSIHCYGGNMVEVQPRSGAGVLKDGTEESVIHTSNLGLQDVSYSRGETATGKEQDAASGHLSPHIVETLRMSIAASPNPRASTDARGNFYPEGGRRAWLVVYGSFSGMTASFGLMNTTGTYQAYLSTHQLSTLDPSTISWVFSIYIFLALFSGVLIGPVFDNKGPRALMLAGTICLVGGAFALAESTSKHHALLQRIDFPMITNRY